jgi:hypothetical protein
MNLNPGELLEPIFHFLDDAIANYGVYLYLMLVWQAVAAIVWIFGGGLRRKMRHQPRITAGIDIVIKTPASQPPPIMPIIFHEYDSDCENNSGEGDY